MKPIILVFVIAFLLPSVFTQTRPASSMTVWAGDTCFSTDRIITTYAFDNNPSLCQSIPAVVGGVVRGWPGFVRCQQGNMLLSYCRQDNDTTCANCQTPIQLMLPAGSCVRDGTIGARVSFRCPWDDTILVDEASFAIAWTGFCAFFVVAVVFMALYIHQRRNAVKIYKNGNTQLAVPLM